MHDGLCLQRNGVEVTLLEARDRVGGRVHTLRDAGFACPVDLGASLITGTRVCPIWVCHPQSLLRMNTLRFACPFNPGASLTSGTQGAIWSSRSRLDVSKGFQTTCASRRQTQRRTGACPHMRGTVLATLVCFHRLGRGSSDTIGRSVR